jgi:prepilin-type N-terminal cleavage/methylation domain-containing protein
MKNYMTKENGVNMNKKGFTLIEIIMVMVVVAIMAAVAIPQFINYKTEAKDAKTQMYLGALRSGISNQMAQMMLRCGATSGTWPPTADLAANSIITSACTGGQVISAAERKFITDTALPIMPWGTVNSVVDCSVGDGGGAGSCTRALNGCDTGGDTNKWCYNPATGDIWADTTGKYSY